MKIIAQYAWCFAICSSPAISLAAELGGASTIQAHTRLVPLAAMMARAQLRGMRLREVRWDPVLKQNWAVLEDVEHPEYPLWAERVDTIGPQGSAGGASGGSQPSPGVAPARPSVAIIHYGDRVRLWRNEQNVRIEMSAIAEGSAAAGDEVKLRIPGSGVDGDSGWRVVGIVHGSGDVEMVQ